jgi:hypothetical protein
LPSRIEPWQCSGDAMPKNLKADIDYHLARINFYKQALEELRAQPDSPDKAERVHGLLTIIGDLEYTLVDLEKVFAQRTT